MEHENAIPIWFRLARDIGTEIASGKRAPGERLPSVRDLALTLRVNPNTLQRALAELETAGLIRTERTNGKFVTTDRAVIAAARRAKAEALAADYLNSLADLGFDAGEAAELLRKEETVYD